MKNLFDGFIGAAVGAITTVGIALLTIQTQQKQLVSTEQYEGLRSESARYQKDVAALNAKLSAMQLTNPDTSALQAQVATLSGSNAQLRAELDAALRKQSSPQESGGATSQQTAKSQPEGQIGGLGASDASVQKAASGSRTSNKLEVGKIARMKDDTTISLKYVDAEPNGTLRADFYVNGTDANGSRRVGQRLTEGIAKGSTCFFEVMALEAGAKPPSTGRAIVDFVCKDR